VPTERRPIDRRMRVKVLRARGVLGQECFYKLGKGGMDPRSSHPGTLIGGKRCCDCSGFSSWVYSMSRQQATARKPWSDVIPWLSTRSIYRDATGDQLVHVRLEAPVPGCLVVYSKAPHGHVGIVTEVMPDGRIRGIHCGSGAAGRVGRAIREDDLTWMLDKGAIFVCLREDLE
jgi:hypothetical protein